MAPPSRFRFGIVAHLGLTFLAVSALAVAANLFSIHGTVFVTRTPPAVERIVYVPTPALPAARVVAPATPGSVAVDASALRAAIDELEQAATARANDGGEMAVQRFAAAANNLKGEASALSRTVGSRSGRRRDMQLQSAAGELAETAMTVSRLADVRRKLSREYRTILEGMDARMAQSIDKAWKIFGRVIARESIVELDRRLAEIRRNLTELDLNADQPGNVSQLPASEFAFLEILDKKAASLAQSQGESWVARMRADHGVLVATREAHDRTRRELRARLDALSKERGALVSIVATIASSSPRSKAAIEPPRSETAGGHGAPKLANLPEAASQVRDAEAAAAAPATVRRVENPPRTRLLAWISIVVIVVLFMVSGLMALRVIRPVRQLLEATKRVTQGQLDARVAEDGILELHELGTSFNQMAQRLADAHAVSEDYQMMLETRVFERTRQLQHLAEHDPLTELPNRRQLFTQLTAALREADSGSAVLGVMVLDLDNFKNINDTMGHSYGDCVLQGVAKRLEAVVAASGFSARQGGDEFTIVCSTAGCLDEVVELAEGILRAFQEPLRIEGRELTISVSIGVAAFPMHGNDADALLRAADAALFRAKALGRHRLNVFSPDLLDAAASRFRTEQGLRQAIERGEFELAFQPEVETGVFGVPLIEALLRWRLPDGRLASPNDFLAIAEDSGLIVEISDWVLRSAVATAAGWRREGWSDVRVAINVSPRQVAAADFATRLLQLLDEAELPPGCIEIELTEHVLQTGEATIHTLRTLRSRGIGIALDDFGTGYSTLASLEQLPFTRVKLDRSLVARIDTVDRSLAIAQTIIGLCQRLGLEITAEGVERVEQLDILARAPGMLVQGYLLAAPLPADRVRQEIKRLPSRMTALLAARELPASRPHGKRTALG